MPRAKASRLDTEPELLDLVAAHIRGGLYPERAAIAAGVPASTHYDWQRKGRDELAAIAGGRRPRKTFAAFRAYVEMLERATVEVEAAALAKVTAGEPGWEAAAWLLERRFRDTWGPVRTERSPAATGPASVPQLTGLQELQQHRARRDRRAQEPTGT